MAADLNNQIVKYLDYYVSLQTPPNFAILLRGRWGSGKSWFVKKYIKDHNEKNQDNKFLYVSLYGLSSTAEIEDVFFKELNPFFAKPGVKFVGSLLKGVLKSSLKLDINLYGDSKSEGSITSNFSDASFNPFTTVNEHCVLVFDDLERGKMDILHVLGYINQFVENDGLKTIIIANEEDIFKKEAGNSFSDHSYRSIKEKLIGRTFEIRSEVDGAIIDFISQLQPSVVKSLLVKHISILKRVYVTANYNNLRHLRQAILDFERFYALLPVDSLEKEGLVENILQTFFTISIELKKGQLKTDTIEDLFLGALLRTREKDDPLRQIQVKYSAFDQFHRVIAPKNWSEYFIYGVTDSEELKRSIYDSFYYENENTPAWKKLSNFHYLAQQQFDELFTSVNNTFQNLNVQTARELVEIVALFLYFSKNKIIDLPQVEILEKARKNMDRLQRSGVLKAALNTRSYFPDKGRSPDPELYAVEEFKTFFSQLHNQIETNRTEILKLAADDLLDTLTRSVQQFDEKLQVDKQGISYYWNKPILKHIDVSAFVSAFWHLNPADRYTLGHTLKNRYRDGDDNQKLSDELPWLIEVKERIEKENGERQEKLTHYLVETKILDLLTSAIDSLKTSNTVSEQ